MAGGRLTRKKSKASNTGKRSLESTVSNAETEKGKSGGALAVKGKKLKLQDKEENERSDDRVDGDGIADDSQESKYVPPFSRSAKKLTDNKCEGGTETKGKSKRQARGKKSRQGKIHDRKSTQEKNQKEQTVVEKENHNFQEVGSVAIEVEANAEIRTADLERNPEEDVMDAAKECMETILQLVAGKKCEYGDSEMDVASEHPEPIQEAMKDEMKPTHLEEGMPEASPGLVQITNMDMCAKDEGTSRRNSLKHTANDGLDVKIARTDVSLHETIHKFVKSNLVADQLKQIEETSQRMPDVVKDNSLIAGDGEGIIASKLQAVAMPNSAEKHVECHAEVEGTDIDFIKGLELVAKEYDSIMATNNNGNDNSDLGGNDIIGSIDKNNTDYQMDVNNNNSSRSNGDNKTLPPETELEKAAAVTDQEVEGEEAGGRLSREGGFEIDRSKRADNTVSDQQVPMPLLLDQDKEEMKHQNDTSMPTAEGRCLVSVKQMDSNGIQAALGSFQHVIKLTKNTVVCELDGNDSGYLEQQSSAIDKVEDNSTETCLSRSGMKDVLPEEKQPLNEKEQALVLGIIPNVDHTQSGTFCNTALQPIHENPNMGKDLEPNHTAIQEQSTTAIAADQRALTSKDSTPAKMNPSSGQPVNMEHVKQPSGVADQDTAKSDVDMTEKVNDECLLDVECEMDCTDSQLVDLDERSLQAIVVDTIKERSQTSRFAESDKASRSQQAPGLAADVSRATENEVTVTCDMIKGLTTELSALNRYLMGAWKEVETIRKQRQARLKASKSKRTKE